MFLLKFLSLVLALFGEKRIIIMKGVFICLSGIVPEG